MPAFHSTLPLWVVVAAEFLARSGVLSPAPSPIYYPDAPDQGLSEAVEAIEGLRRQVVLSRQCAPEEAPESHTDSERPLADSYAELLPSFVAAGLGTLSGLIFRFCLVALRACVYGDCCCAGRRPRSGQVTEPLRGRRRGGGVLA